MEKIKKTQGIDIYLKDKALYDELIRLEKEEIIERYIYRMKMKNIGLMFFSLLMIIFAALFWITYFILQIKLRTW